MALIGLNNFILGNFSNVNLAVPIIAILVVILQWYWRKPKRLPPGPPALPFVGHLSCIGDNPHLKFNQLAKKYGPIFRVYFGNRLVVVLNNYESIKEAFINQAETFVGRPKMHLQSVDTDRFSMILSDNIIWKTHRRFALNVMRDCGIGKLRIEPLIMKEIQIFLSEVMKYNGEPKDFSELIILSVSNNICIPLYGKRYEYDDPWFLFATKHIKDNITDQSAVSIYNFFPWLQKLPLIDKILGREYLADDKKKFKFSQHLKIREGKINHLDGQRDTYMNAFITEQKAKASKNELTDIFSDEALEENMSLLLLAGTETTANTIMWCILYMAANPDIQNKVQKEIDYVIGTGRTSCYSDRLQTPYTEATLLEVQRIATLVPINVPHRNTKDCELLGYKIPKDTFILANLWAAHMDKNTWEDPEVFKPERFMSPDGKFTKKDGMIPFSIGKRECPGKILAVMELYLYFTSLLQAFTFKSADGSKPNLEPRAGFTVAPKHFNVRAVRRNTDLVYMY